MLPFSQTRHFVIVVVIMVFDVVVMVQNVVVVMVQNVVVVMVIIDVFAIVF